MRILLLYPYVVNITLWVGLTETDESSSFDKRDAPIGRGETKKRPVIDHETNNYNEIRRLLVSFNKLHPFGKLPTSYWVGHR